MAGNGRRGAYNNCNIPLLPPPPQQVYSGEYRFTTPNPVASWDYSFVPNQTGHYQQQWLGSTPVAGQQGQPNPLIPPTYELDPNLALVSVNPPPGTSSSSEQIQPGYYLFQRLETPNIMDMPNVEPPGLIPPLIPERLWKPAPAINTGQMGNVPQRQPLQVIPQPPPTPPTRSVSMVVPVAQERKHLLKDPLIVNVPVIAPEFGQAYSYPRMQAPLVPEYVSPLASPSQAGPSFDEGMQRPPRPRSEQGTSSSSFEGGDGRPRNRDVSIPHTHCKFCTSNGEVWRRASTHVLRDDDGKVRCPVLRAHLCHICGATGDFAHTARYCPQKRGQLQTEAAANTGEEGEQNRPNSSDDDRYVHRRSSAGGYTFQKY